MNWNVVDRFGNVVFVGAFQSCHAWANARNAFAAAHKLPLPWFKISPVR